MNDSRHDRLDEPVGIAGDAPAIPPEMMAKAAAILGVETAAPARGNESNLVLVTVAGPDARKVARVPIDVPAGRLAKTLGEAVGVDMVARLSVRNGEVIRPAETLAEVGVRTGSVIVVDDPASPGLADSDHRPVPSQGHWPSVAPRPALHQARTPRQWAVLGSAVAAIATIAFFASGAFLGTSATAAGPDPLAARAARAWLADRVFSGPRLAGVPADLGRHGGAIQAALEPAGSSSSSGITSQQFIVAPRPGAAFGLTVVLYQGKVAYPPTISALPFVQPAGRRVPEAGNVVHAGEAGPAQSWAHSTFGAGAKGTLSALGYEAGKAKVIQEWEPKSGAAFVVRIEVPLSSSAPGSPMAAARAKAAGAFASARAAVALDRQAVAKDQSAVTGDQQALSRANAAAQAAVGGTSAGKPLSNAAKSAQQAATNAGSTLSAEQRTLNTDKTRLAADLKTETTAAGRVHHLDAVAPQSALGVYDVAFAASGKALAWSPADYSI